MALYFFTAFALSYPHFLGKSHKSTYNNFIIKFDKIPFKQGYPKLDYCIKWNISEEEFDILREKIKSILPNIAAKYINTYSFLHMNGKEDNYGVK